MKRTLMAAAMAGALPAFACGGLQVESAWVRLPPPGHEHAAGYFVVRNSGSAAVELTAVGSPDFESGMLHETVYDDGQARMRHLAGVRLDAGAVLRAAPGGRHVMLSGPRHALINGQTVRLVFECAGGASLEASAALRSRAPD